MLRSLRWLQDMMIIIFDNDYFIVSIIGIFLNELSTSSNVLILLYSVYITYINCNLYIKKKINTITFQQIADNMYIKIYITQTYLIGTIKKCE